MRLGVFCAAVLSAICFCFAGSGLAYATNVANWEKSARSWNNSHMSTIKAAVTAAGHKVLADAPINDQTLLAGVFIMGEPIAAPTAAEAAKLHDYVQNGGIVLVFGDTGIDLPTYNGLLAGIGSSIQYTTSTVGTSSALPEGMFTGAPSKIAGGTLTVTSGNGTSGGTLIDSNYVRYERLGNGYVFVFGDRIDHNEVISPTNTTLLLNIVAVAPESPLLVPTLSEWALAALALLLAGVAALHAARRAVPASNRPRRR